MSLTLLLNSQEESYTAQSVIFDIADNYGGGEMGIRQIDFYLNGSKLIFDTWGEDVGVAAWADATSAFNWSDFLPAEVFETNLSYPKTGPACCGVSWLSNDTNTPQRLIVFSFSGPFTFDDIVVNNYHDSGSDTNKGAKNVVVTISDDIIFNNTYNAVISNSTVIFDGQFTQHEANDVEDGQNLLSVPVSEQIDSVFSTTSTMSINDITIIHVISKHSNHYKFQKQLGLINLTSDNLLTAIMDDTYVFDKDTDATLSDISSNIIAGQDTTTLDFVSHIENDTDDKSTVLFKDFFITAFISDIDVSGIIVYDNDTIDNTVIGFIDFNGIISLSHRENLMISNIYFDDL